jgi:nitrite reductase/ring-hydroxylating ferredoxin subunit
MEVRSSPIEVRPRRLCRFDELTPGAARGFDPDGTGEDSVFVLRRGDAVRAYLNRCPHQNARLEYRKDRFLSADGQHVVCYAHGAHFDPDTGACTLGACLGQSLQPVPCRVEHGWVWTVAAARPYAVGEVD